MSSQTSANNTRAPKRVSFHQGGRLSKKQRKAKAKAGLVGARFEGSHDEILHQDIRDLVKETQTKDNEKAEIRERFSEVEVTIVSVSSTGDGLGYEEGNSQIYVVPFTVEGDRVRARVIRHGAELPYTITDFLKVVQPSPDRDDSLVKCPYFASCSGCQFQMIPYALQLEKKKRTIEKAYRNFSGLGTSDIPTIRDTIGSPLEYGYRTKLTPHFDGPPGFRHAGRRGDHVGFKERPPIGFMKKGTKFTMDIEVCPIGTEAVQMGLTSERDRVEVELEKFKRGATLLLRESTMRLNSEKAREMAEKDRGIVLEEQGDGQMLVKHCITNNNSTTTEYVDDYIFKNPASAFFQNNNSILPRFTQYIRDHIQHFRKSSEQPGGDSSLKGDGQAPLTNLIDAYSGSGLFTITLSSMFNRSIGIDVSSQSIEYARTNTRLNGLSQASPSSQSDNTEKPAETTTSTHDVSFIAADASDLFASVPQSFAAHQTVVVIDPPRKGCDENFLRQLVKFGPERIVYVSCNVHTQARDVGWILGRYNSDQGEASQHQDSQTEPRYTIESLQGFDFFPQTNHVETVAVLQRVRLV